jgi:hypothetical protein
MRKHLYLDFTGYKRTSDLMRADVGEIDPGFRSVREHGLNMIDASQLSPPISTHSDAVTAASG